MSFFSLLGAVEIGLIFSLVALGVFISFRLLRFPDLTVDGSFPLDWRRAAADRTDSLVSALPVARRQQLPAEERQLKRAALIALSMLE